MLGSDPAILWWHYMAAWRSCGNYLQILHALVELLVGFGKSPLNLIALLFGLKRLSLLYFLSVEFDILLQLFVLQ